MPYIKRGVPRRAGNDKANFWSCLSVMSSICFVKRILQIGLWALIHLLSQVLTFRMKITLAKSCKLDSGNISVVFG